MQIYEIRYSNRTSSKELDKKAIQINIIRYTSWSLQFLNIEYINKTKVLPSQA